MKAREVIEEYVFRHYGNLTTVGSVAYEDESKRWIAELKSDYPRWIKDDRSDSFDLRFISMDNIGKIVFSDDFGVLEATTRSECGDRIWDRLNLWRDSAERIMVEASADQLAMARGADQFLSPIITILDNLENPLHSKPLIYRDDVEAGGANRFKYLSLLQELSIVREIPDEKAWTYGPLFTTLSESAKTRGMAFERAVFAHILKNRYPAIRDVFHISVFEKIIHLDSSYYWQALDAERPVITERENLFTKYKYQYGNEDEEADRMNLNSKLMELARVKALKVEGGYVIADDGLLKQMIILKHQIAERGTPHP